MGFNDSQTRQPTGLARDAVAEQLLEIEGQWRTRPRVVASQTLGARGEAPGLGTNPARLSSITKSPLTDRATRRHQLRVGPGLIPPIAVGLPTVAALMQELGFYWTRGFWPPCFSV